MLRKLGFALFCASSALFLSGCMKPYGQSPGKQNDGSTADAMNPIANAESGAPASIAHEAAIVVPDANGAMKTLRAGKNGWTCMPDDPSTPANDPMCGDGNAMKWASAWAAHTPPPDDQPGVAYMLQGASDPSNTDPFAKRPAPGADWVRTGPHLMILGSKAILAGYPSGPKPDTSGPYVMWAGTPYAHLMVPVTK